MENSERQFESQWQQAFRGAEAAAPSEVIWLSIDRALSKAENERNKNRIVFYQRLAATLLLICTASVLVTFWQWKSSVPVQITSKESTVPSGQAIAGNDRISNGTASKSNQENLQQSNNGKMNGAMAVKKKAGKTNLYTIPETDAVAESKSLPALDSFRVQDDSLSLQLTESIPAGKTKSLTTEEEKELADKLKAQIEEEEPEKKKSLHASWASIGVAGGTYSPGASSTPQSGALFDMTKSASSGFSQTSQQARPNTGTSYSIGVLAGKQLHRHWIVQAGITYWKQTIDIESDVVDGTGLDAMPFASNYSIAKSNSSYNFTTPYAVSNISEFISLPVQLGYVLLDRKIGWVVSAGVSPDFFIHNSLKDKSGTYGDYAQSPGENAAFRNVSWSGMANTEINFKLSDHYRLAFVPGVRYSFTNIIKDDAGSSQPLVLDVGFRFRYIFK